MRLRKFLADVPDFAKRGARLSRDVDLPGRAHLLSENLVSASTLRRSQTKRLKATTTANITTTLAESSGKFAAAAASLICAPRPQVASAFPLKVTYSETMLAFQAPPAAVTQPVTRYGKIAGK